MQHIVIVEDHTDYAAWLMARLRTHWPDACLWHAQTLSEARALIAGLPAEADGLALVDLGLPDGSGLDIIRGLAESHPRLLPVVATIFDDDEHVFTALAAGAGGYLLKDHEGAQMLEHLERIRAGVPPISAAVAQRMLAYFRARPAMAAASPRGLDEPRLTPREQDVLRVIGRGLRVPEAARSLGLTEHTVASYVKVLYRKLNVSSRAEAALEAARRGLV